MNAFESPELPPPLSNSLVDKRYDLIFRGVREGYDKELLQKKFAILFKLSPAQVEKVFAAKRIRLKTQLTKSQALDYRQKLYALGFRVETPPVAQKASLGSTCSPVEKSRAIYKTFIPDDGVQEQDDAAAMHQMVEAPFGEGVQRYAVQSGIQAASFFSLGLTNLLLCLVSLGLWYPWARVRHWRYCFSQTRVAGEAFEFHGNPHFFLVTQLVLGGCALGLIAAFFISPLLFLLGLVLYVALLPAYWGFKDFYYTHHVSYAGERFKSTMTTQKAYGLFGVYGLLVLLTGGLAAPWAFKRLHQGVIATKSFAGFSLRLNSTTADYGELLKPLLAAWLLTGFAFQTLLPLPFWLSLLLTLVSGWGLLSYWKLRLDNLLWNSVSCSLGRWQRLLDWQSSVRWQLSYLLLMVVSLGILSPWLSAFRWRWLAQHTAFLANPRFKKWLASHRDN